MQKKCGRCGQLVEFTDSQKSQYFIGIGAPSNQTLAYNYFYMWHKYIEVCPHCGYACIDVSKPSNPNKNNVISLDIVNYLKSYNFKGVINCLNAVNNEISNGNTLDAIKLLFQASDMLYSAIIAINEYEQGDDEPAIGQVKGAEEYADKLWNIGLTLLITYVKNNPTDIDANIFLGCMYLDGTKQQQNLGLNVLQSLKNNNLSTYQLSIINYVLKMV